MAYCFNPWIIPPLISLLISILLLVILIVKGVSRLCNIVFATILISFIIYNFFIIMMWCSAEKEIAIFWLRMNQSLAIILTGITFHFSLVFPWAKKWIKGKHILITILYLPIGTLVALAQTDYVFTGVVIKSSLTLEVEKGHLAILLASFYLLYFTLIIINFIHSYVSTRSKSMKSQVKFILIGCTPTFLASVIFPISVIFFDFELNPFYSVAYLYMMLVLMYSIYKYQFLGIEIVFKKSLFLTIITVLIAVVFFVVSEFLEAFLAERFFKNIPISNLFAAVAVLVLLYPIALFSQKLSKKMFPGVESSKEYYLKRKAEIYRAQLEAAWFDGIMSKKETIMLKALRESLKISWKQHTKMEIEVKRELLVD